jgi:NitT/TauT family transport system permease protein
MGGTSGVPMAGRTMKKVGTIPAPDLIRGGNRFSEKIMPDSSAILPSMDSAVIVESGASIDKFWQRAQPALLGGGTIAALLLLWQCLPLLMPLSPGTKLFFTTPSGIARALWTMFATGTIWQPLSVSVSGFALGLALAIAVGLPLGVLLGRSRTLDAMLDPFITAFNATPRLVFLPLLLLWFGLGLWTKVVVVFIGALFPIVINTYEGVRNSDKVLINVVRSFGAKEWDIARLVVVPNAMPYIVAGLRLAIGRAILGVVVAEFFGSEEGLGVVMLRAASSYHVDIVFAGLIIFAALSLVMTSLVKSIENRLSRWRPQPAGG